MDKAINKFSIELVSASGVSYGYLNHNNLKIFLADSNEVSHISFKIPEFINDDLGVKIDNPYYGRLLNNYTVILEIDNDDKGMYEHAFRVADSVKKSNGSTSDLTYNCYSYETILSQKRIIEFIGVPVDANDNSGVSIDGSGNVTYIPISAVDIVDYKIDGLNIAELYTILLDLTGSEWELDFIDPLLIDVLRSDFVIRGTDLLSEALNVAKRYDAVFVPDTINKKVRFYKLESLGQNLNMTIEYGKYLKMINSEEKTDGIVTRMRASGAGGIGISGVTYTGQNYVENYDYFLGSFERSGPTVVKSSEWMSDSLALALTDYEAAILAAQPGLDVLIGQREAKIDEKIAKESEIRNLELGENVTEEIDTVANAPGSCRITLSNSCGFISSIDGVGIVEAKIGDDLIFIPFAKTPTGTSTGDVSGNTYMYQVQILNSENIPNYGGSILYFDILEYPIGTTIRTQYQTFGLIQVEVILNAYVSMLATGTVSALNKVTYDLVVAELNSDRDVILGQLQVAQSELAIITSELDVINDSIQTIYDTLSVESNFTQAQLEEWENFIIEDIYQNNNITDESELLIETQAYLDSRKIPDLLISIDSISILQTHDAKQDWDKINLFDFVNVRFERFGLDIDARIVEITIDVDNYNMGLVIAPNLNYFRNEKHYEQKNIIKNASSSNNVDFGNNIWNAAEQNTDVIDEFSSTGIGAENYNINASNQDSVIVDEIGITISEKVAIDVDFVPEINQTTPGNNEKYGDRFVRIANGGIYLTEDGGTTFSTAITARQIYANVIKGDLLVGNELQILGNDGSGDSVFIGNVAVYNPPVPGSPIADFGILVKGNDGTVETELSMGVGTGFNIYTELDPLGAPGVLTSVFSSQRQISAITYSFADTFTIDTEFKFNIPVASDSDIVSFGMRIIPHAAITYTPSINGNALAQNTTPVTYNITNLVTAGDNTLLMDIITGGRFSISIFGTVSADFRFDEVL